MLTATPTNALCNGSNGSIAFSATGGTGTITYKVNNVIQTSPYSIIAGVYTVQASDANGCLKTTSVSISQPTSIVLTATPTNALCNGSNGSLAFSATGGTGVITYKVNAVTQTSPYATIAGIYTVQATDANGCTTTTTVSISQPTSIVLTATPTNALCNGSNGSLAFSATGGTGVITYKVNTLNQVSPYSAIAGTYTVQATDANGCTATTTVSISQPSVVTATITNIINVSCFGGSNGSATVSSVSGGTGTYTYSWLPTGGTSSVASGLSANIYTVTVKDANLCTITKTVSITQPTSIVLTATPTNALCNGSNGSVAFSATGGTGVITYKVNTLNQVSPYSAIAGTYTVQATDANGCSTTTSVSITQPSLVAAVMTNVTNVSCFGGNNGSVSVSASGGTGTYTYSWSPSGGSSSTATGLSANIYIVTVKDANLCTVTKTVSITQPTIIVLTATPTNALCNGVNGSIDFNATGGTGTITYKVNTVNQLTPYSTIAGTYTVQATDANGCSISTLVTVSQPSVISLTATPTNALCNGANGSIDFSAIGGTGAISYNVNSVAQTSPFVTIAGTYTVQAIDAIGCTTTISSVISEPALMVVSAGNTIAICKGSSSNLTATGALTYSWSPSVGLNSTTSSAVSANPIVNTTYTITGTDGNGCISTGTILVKVNSLPIVNAGPDLTLCSGSSKSIVATGAIAYNWSPSTGLNTTSSNIVIASPTTNTTYIVTGSDVNGCKNVDTINVTVGVNPNATATISGSGTASQSATTTSSIVFAGNGGINPYTFTYSVNNGTSQNVTTLSTSNNVILPTSNATIGSFIYKLLSFTDSNGCIGIVPSSPNNYVTRNVVSGGPDLSPTIPRPLSTTFSNGQSRDGYVQFTNNGTNVTFIILTFKISQPSNFSLVISPTITTSAGVLVDNEICTISYNSLSKIYTVTTNTVLPINGNLKIGFTLINNGAPTTIGNMNVTVSTGTGGDSNITNNQVIKTFSTN